MSTTWTVRAGEAETTAVLEPTSTEVSSGTFVCAHGAGGNMSDRGTLAIANLMRRLGLDVVRFNFLYKEQKRGRPDPMPVLKATYAAVVDRVRAETSPRRLLIGGRSMGGRTASMMAAEQFACDGLVLFAYPLHPDKKPEQLRDAHLPAITVPTLCFNGTRDTMCRRDLMEAVLPRLGPNFRMHWLEGADHMFHVLKSSGRTDADVMAEVEAVSRDWLGSLSA